MHWKVITISTRLVVESFSIHPDSIIMYLLILWKADSFTVQPFYMCSEIKVFSLNFPCPVFSCSMHLWRYIFGISTPIIGMIKGNRKRFKQFPSESSFLTAKIINSMHLWHYRKIHSSECSTNNNTLLGIASRYVDIRIKPPACILSKQKLCFYYGVTKDVTPSRGNRGN